MKIMVKIGDISYGDVAVKALPMLRKKIVDNGSAVNKILCAITELPPEPIHGVFNAIPYAEKNGIVAALVEENKERIIRIANGLAQENGIGISLRDLSVTEGLEIHAVVGEIDYQSIVVKFLPLVKEKLTSSGMVPVMLRPVINRASAGQILGILNQIPQESKDAIVLFAVNQYRERIKEMVVKTVQSNGIALTVEALAIQS